MNFKDVAKELPNDTSISIWLSKDQNKPQLAVYFHDNHSVTPIETHEFDLNGAVVRALMVAGS